MAERRKLIEGITPAPSPVDPNKEQEFVFGEAKEKKQETSESPATPPPDCPRHHVEIDQIHRDSRLGDMAYRT